MRQAVASKPVTESSPPKKLSRVEGLKRESSQLRFPLKEQLANKESFISESAVQIMKFHGSYQQDDREQRRPGQPKRYQFMLRLKMPGGEFPFSLYQVLDDLSSQYGNHTLRATTRCAWQMHGVFKGDLKKVFSSIMNAGGSCIGACGDLSRNVMCTPAPFVSKPYAHARFVARMLGELFAPQTGAFSEVWLDGEKAATLEFWKHDLDMNEVNRIMRHDNGNGVVFPDKEEPIYGETYLPRKFKIGVTVPGDNSIDIYTQDIGIVCIPDRDGDIVGYNIMVGGGMGRTHNKESTFPRIADPIGFVAPNKLWEACKAIVATQRDHGNRSIRANARMKYLVEKLGIDAFRKLVESYMGEPFQPYRTLREWKYEDWLGWHEQGDGNLFLGLFIENGRIKNEGDFRLKTALRRIIDAYHFHLVISPNQNIIIKDISPAQKDGIRAILQEHGVKLPEEYDQNRKLAMACPALPLCGLAVTEAERHMPQVVDRMNALFAQKGVTVPITMRMTGCPNGCARPYMAELGFVGSGPLTYQLWLGGAPNQTRLAWAHIDKVKDADMEATIGPILDMYKQQSQAKEAFGDFCARVGADAIKAFSKEMKERAASPADTASPGGDPMVYESPISTLPKKRVTVARATRFSIAGENVGKEVAAKPERQPTPATKNIADNGVPSAPEAPTRSSAPVAAPVVKPAAVAQPAESSSEAGTSSTAAGGTSTEPAETESQKVAEAASEDATTKRSRARKLRPRLTVSTEIMERLKSIAALRDMTASQVADELLTNYLSGVEDEDLMDDVE